MAIKEDIQKLRLLTGAGVMDCKRALEEAGGDFEKAEALVRERGIVIAEKKEGRKTGAGLLKTYVHNNRVGVLLEIRAETDFAVHSEQFQELSHNVAMQIAAMDPKNVDELMEEPYIKDASLTVRDLVKQTMGKVGENITVERFCRYEL